MTLPSTDEDAAPLHERHFQPVEERARLVPDFRNAPRTQGKQIQQNYRPIIGIHKWFARPPGTVFRSLLLAEYSSSEPLETSYWREHRLTGVIADPFMGGGTPIYEANRLGFSVLGTDSNPMAFWVVRQALGLLDIQEFASAAEEVASDIEDLVGPHAPNCELFAGRSKYKGLVDCQGRRQTMPVGRSKSVPAERSLASVNVRASCSGEVSQRQAGSRLVSE